MNQMKYDHEKLRDLVGLDLSAALVNVSHDVPRRRGGLRLICLKNAHFRDQLLCDNLPPDALVPWHYEGGVMQVVPDLVPEPTTFEPVWPDGGILERFGRCQAIY